MCIHIICTYIYIHTYICIYTNIFIHIQKLKRMYIHTHMCIATCPCVKKSTIAKLLGRGGPLLLLITPCRFDPFGPRRPVGVTGPLVFPCSRPGSRRLPPALLLPSFLLLRLPAVLLLRPSFPSPVVVPLLRLPVLLLPFLLL